MRSKESMTEEAYKMSLGEMKPMDSKVCRMILYSRMILTPEQQKFVCDGDLANYMESAPEWLKEKDDTSKNWMDLDNKMTATIALVRAIGKKYFLMPDDPAQFEKCEKIEKLMFGVMNSMVYLINKICFAPNSTECKAFDNEYARERFLKKFSGQLPKLDAMVEGPFIMGDSLPVHADYLLYACCCDITAFCPTAFDKSPKMQTFIETFRNYPSPIRRFFKTNDAKEGEYIRPAVPHIMCLLPEDAGMGDLA